MTVRPQYLCLSIPARDVPRVNERIRREVLGVNAFFEVETNEAVPRPVWTSANTPVTGQQLQGIMRIVNEEVPPGQIKRHENFSRQKEDLNLRDKRPSVLPRLPG